MITDLHSYLFQLGFSQCILYILDVFYSRNRSIGVTQGSLLGHLLFLIQWKIYHLYLYFVFFLLDTWELKHATRNISPTNNQANIVDLHPASVYSIRMYSYNAIGKSEASKELTISTEEARKSFYCIWHQYKWVFSILEKLFLIKNTRIHQNFIFCWKTIVISFISDLIFLLWQISFFFLSEQSEDVFETFLSILLGGFSAYISKEPVLTYKLSRQDSYLCLYVLTNTKNNCFTQLFSFELINKIK